MKARPPGSEGAMGRARRQRPRPRTAAPACTGTEPQRQMIPIGEVLWGAHSSCSVGPSALSCGEGKVCQSDSPLDASAGVASTLAAHCFPLPLPVGSGGRFEYIFQHRYAEPKKYPWAAGRVHVGAEPASASG